MTLAILKLNTGQRVTCQIMEPAKMMRHKWHDEFGVTQVGERKKVLVKYVNLKGEIQIKRICETRILKNNDGSYMKPEVVQ